MGKIVQIDEATCTGCGNCVSLCPQQILYVDKASKKCKVTDESMCDRFKGCERVCKSKSIKIV